jgi:hypothetical protein
MSGGFSERAVANDAASKIKLLIQEERDMNLPGFRAINPFIGLFIVGLSVLAASASASSVRQVSLNEMTAVCEFIFEGRVTGQQVKTGTEAGDIRTVVTFEVLDVIKGEAVGDTVELQFLGGTFGDRALKVTDMHLPQIGEKGIYFVESLERQYVNPICAWDQGHFLIERDVQNDTEIVKTRARQPIYGIEATRSVQGRGLSQGVAAGVRLRQQVADEKPVDVEDFKWHLRTLLAGQKK